MRRTLEALRLLSWLYFRSCKAFVAAAISALLVFSAVGVQAQSLVQVQVYENTVAFPGEIRFFMTAREQDKAFLASNPQMGWRGITTFTAHAAGEQSAATSNVCRFFLPTLATHFYTADAGECERFKRDPLFLFEGLDFAVVTPVAGRCEQGHAPLYRAFNAGELRGVTGNHFFGVDANLRSYLVSMLGWIDEGVVIRVPAHAAQADVTRRVVFGGRKAMIGASNRNEPGGLPIAQVMDADTLQSTAWVDPLAGESDWLDRSAFDSLRGKLYLVRATAVVTRSVAGIGGLLNPGSPSGPVWQLEPTRDVNNLMELDVATGSARYLNIGGTFSDVHFNAKRRLLALSSPSIGGEARLTWFDPLQNKVVSSTRLGAETVDVAIRHVGQPACEYFVKQASLGTAYSIPFYSPYEIATTGCVGLDGALSGMNQVYEVGTLDHFGSSRPCVLGDSMYVPYSSQDTVRRHRVGALEFLGDLPRADFGPPISGQLQSQRPVLCYVLQGDLWVITFATYEANTRGYFALQYRDGRVLTKLGPLTPAEVFFTAPFPVIDGRFPTQFSGTDLRLVNRGSALGSEIWVLSPRFVERPQDTPQNVLQRIDQTSFERRQFVPLALPARRLHGIE